MNGRPSIPYHLNPQCAASSAFVESLRDCGVEASESRLDGGIGGGHEGEDLRQRRQPCDEVDAEREKPADPQSRQNGVHRRRSHGSFFSLLLNIIYF